MTLCRFESLGSTNRYCERLDLDSIEEFTCYWALKQTDGVGQRGNHWESAPGMNLTFSVVLHPDFLPAVDQFQLTQMLSLAICDMLDEMSLPHKALIKWPNDIYVDGGKLCGMLSSVRLSAGRIGSAVCGVGLNVNQTEFPDWIPHPMSLRMLLGRSFELEPLLLQLLHHMERRYDALGRHEDMMAEYLDRLMRRGEPAYYNYRGQRIEATITGVDTFGHLLLDSEGKHLNCDLKEIEFVI